MGSDRPAAMGPTTPGNNASISISTDSEAEATRVFNGLSAGGQVTMPLEKAFWGSYFGMLTDRFGIQWMVSYDYNQQPFRTIDVDFGESYSTNIQSGGSQRAGSARWPGSKL